MSDIYGNNAISAPILGYLSDRYGRRPILLFSVAGTIIGFIILGFARTLPLLFLARIVDGLSAGNTPTAFAYIADITTKKERTYVMSIISSSFWSGVALGFVLGGILSRYGYGLPSFIAAVITGIGLALAYYFLPETYTPQIKETSVKTAFSIRTFFSIFSHPILGGIIILVFIRELLSWFYDSTVSLFSEHTFHATAQQVGFLFAYIAVIGTFMQLILLKKLLTYMKEHMVIFLSFSIIMIGFILIAFGMTVQLFLIGTTIMVIGFSMAKPVYTALVSKTSSKDEQGKSMGILDMVTTIGSLLGPLAALFLYGFSPRLPYIVGITICIIALSFSMLIALQQKR